MNFSEFIQGLYPYLAESPDLFRGPSISDFVVDLVTNFIKPESVESCNFLNLKPDTLYRYAENKNPVNPKDAKYIYDQRNIEGFCLWISTRMDNKESRENVSTWLEENNIDHQYPYFEDDCALLFKNILLDIINKREDRSSPFAKDKKALKEIEKQVGLLSKPQQLTPPTLEQSNEQTYIEELYKAYGDAESKTGFCKDDLKNFPDYAEDLKDRRIDFYAAESVRRSVLELSEDALKNQFEVLKDETYAGIKDVARMQHKDGYEHMLNVMAQAVSVEARAYILASSPYWNNNAIKKGVCHHLVNDKKLKWVK